MKIAILTSALDIGVGGGVANIVLELQKHFQKKISPPPIIYSYQKFYKKREADKDLNIKLFYHHDPFKYGFSPRLLNDIRKHNYDLLHIYGIWEFFSYVAYKWHKETNKPYIISTQGMLEPWAFDNSKIKKRLMYHLLDKKYLLNASSIIVSSSNETQHLRKLGIHTPVKLVPNGVDITERTYYYPEKWIKDFGDKKKILLFMGRIHPKKSIEELILAISEIKENLGEWRLVIYGWGNEIYVNHILDLIKGHNLNNYIYFGGSVFDNEKFGILQHASAFILPSKSEGIPIAVREAWANNLPTLITEECNLSFAFQNNSAIKIRFNIDELKKDLKSFFIMDKTTLENIGKNAYKLARNEYNWNKISDMYIELYKSIVNS